MTDIFNFPQYRTVYYGFNPETGYYTKSEKQAEKTPVMRLPYELRFAETQAEQIKANAKHIIHSKQKKKDGSYQFMTGLQDTGLQNWYLGNDYECRKGIKKISIVIFRFSEDNSRMTVFYFPHFDKPSTDLRLQFARSFIPKLLQSKTLCA